MKLKPLAITCAIIVGLLTAIVFFLTNTTAGAHLVYRAIVTLTDNKLSIREIDGTLAKGIRVRDAQFIDEKVNVTLPRANASISLRDLLLNQIVITSLNADGLDVQISAHQEKKEPNLAWLKYLTIEHARLTNISYLMPLEKQRKVIFNIDLDAQTHGMQTRLEKFVVTSPLFDVDAHGELSRFYPFNLNLTLNAKNNSKQKQAFAAIAHIYGSAHNLKYTSTITAPFKLSLAGAYTDETTEPQISLTAQWTHLQWPFIGESQFASEKGSFSVEGPMSKYALKLQTQLSGHAVPDSQIDISGHGNSQQLMLSPVVIHALDGKITANVVIDDIRNRAWHTQIDASKLNPRSLPGGRDGSIDFSVTANGSNKNEFFIDNFAIKKLTGALLNKKISGAGAVAIVNNQPRFDQLQVSLGDNHFSANGGFFTNWDLHWSLNANDLTQLSRELSGTIQSDGTLRGQTNSAQIAVKSHINHVSYQHLQNLNGAVSIEGTLAHHTIAANFSTLQQSISLQATGHTQNQIWNGALNQFSLHTSVGDHWKATQPIPITLAQHRIEIPHRCFHSDNQSICGAVNWQGKHNFTNDIEVTHLKTHYVEKFLPFEVKLFSLIDGHINLMQNNKQQSGIAQFKLTPGNIQFTLNKQPHQFMLQQASLNAALNNQGFNAKAHAMVSATRSLNADFSLPNLHELTWPSDSQRIAGHVNLQSDDLSLVQSLYSDLRDLNGHSAINLEVGGTVGKPNLTGSATLHCDNARLNSLGIRLNDVNLVAKGLGYDTLLLEGSALSGNGKLIVNGTTSFAHSIFSSNFTIKGSNVEVVNVPQYHIFASPDLHITTQNRDVDVTGTLLIPQANVQPRDFDDSVELPPETTFVADSKDEEISTPLNVSTHVRVEMGDNVHLKLLGLNGRVSGRVNISDDKDKQATASGTLQLLDGTYEAYGTKLSVERGMFVFAGGSLDNPGVNLRASRVIANSTSDNLIANTTSFINTDNVKVGVDLTGTISDLKVSLFSQPANLSQADILSLLVLGKRANEVTNVSDQNRLLSTSNLVNVGGSSLSLLTPQLEHIFKLDSVRFTNVITPADPNDTRSLATSSSAVQLSKAISSKLYIDYTFGLAKWINIIRIRYLINKKWAVQGENNGNANGFDILYTIE